MPSKQMPGSTSTRESFPEIAAAIGEDPARYLDRDFVADPPDPGGMHSREWLWVRIQGIDDLGVIARWQAVERQLDRSPDEGREPIMQLLRKRAKQLQKGGERVGRCDLEAARDRKRERLARSQDRDAEWYRELAAQSGPGAVGSTARETFGSPAEQLAETHADGDGDDDDRGKASPLADELAGLADQLDPQAATDGGTDSEP
jgi:hypothetical protein